MVFETSNFVVLVSLPRRIVIHASSLESVLMAPRLNGYIPDFSGGGTAFRPSSRSDHSSVGMEAATRLISSRCRVAQSTIIGEKSSQCCPSAEPLYMATVAQLSPSLYCVPRGTGWRTILITRYSTGPGLRSVNTARVNGERATTRDGLTHPNLKRNLTRTQKSTFKTSINAATHQDEGCPAAHTVAAAKQPAKPNGQIGKCCAYRKHWTETPPGFDAVVRASTKTARLTTLIKPNILS